MLGKTNISALQEGGTVTEIEDFSWIQIQTGISSDFYKVICQNGYLAGITQDGIVAYTVDGEVWKNSKLNYEQCRINDIDWDGDRFILAGSYMDADLSMDDTTALAVATKDFESWEKLAQIDGETVYAEYLMVYRQNDKYVLAAREAKEDFEYLLQTDFTVKGTESTVIQRNVNGTEHRGSLAAKNSTGVLIYFRTRDSRSSNNNHDVYKIADGNVKRITGIYNRGIGDIYTVFECKDALYIQKMTVDDNYEVCKVTDTGEVMTMSTGINWGFADGVYFDGYQLFINRHEMLVIRKGENIADKTPEDLIEIAPEMTMTCIEKAFGKLYLFGKRGIILRSNTETDNEEAIAVQVISAKKALEEAKVYTDQRIAEIIKMIGKEQ